MTDVRALLKEYIEETEDQGPEFAEDMVRCIHDATDAEVKEIVWCEVQRFLGDFLTYVDVVANEEIT